MHKDKNGFELKVGNWVTVPVLDMGVLARVELLQPRGRLVVITGSGQDLDVPANGVTFYHSGKVLAKKF